jgi:hypothetical protein
MINEFVDVESIEGIQCVMKLEIPRDKVFPEDAD